MLQAIRSKASSFVAKLLFGLLIVTFGVWGIGDIFRDRGADTSVATVGDRKIDAQALNREVQQDAERLRAAYRGANLDAETLKQLGVVDTALQRLINRALIDQESHRLGLAVGADALNEAIRSAPAFQNETGAFDPARYKQFVASQHMTVPQFEAQLKADMVRLQLNAAISDGAQAPSELVDALYRNRAERRVAEVALVPQSAAGDIGAPSEADLSAFYHEHEDQFRVPELRSFSVGLLTLDDVAATITVPEDRLRDEYQSRAGELHVPEQRQLQQILLSDEGKAKDALAQLQSGKDFAEVAKDVAGAEPDTLDIGVVKKDDLPPQLADAAFALKQGEFSQPLQDSFGWHILRVTEIKPEETPSFDAVKDKLAKDVARDIAGDQIAKLANQIDDALAGGAAFADVVQRFGLKESKFEAVDAKGRDAAGKEVALPPSGDRILETAVHTEAGKTSQLNELAAQDQSSGDGYYVVRVDAVTPSVVKPLEVVHEEVAEMWRQQKRAAALEQLSKEMADAASEGKSLAEIAKAHNLSTFTSAPLPRSGGDPKVPPLLVARLFQARTGSAVYARGSDGFAVAQLKEVMPPDPAKEPDGIKRLSEQLVPAMQDDLLQEYDRALRNRFPVSVNQAAVARAF